MEIYRTRHRAIFKVLVEQYGFREAIEMYDPFPYRGPAKCPICQEKVGSYSEWHETGYERERCSNDCWSHETYGMRHDLETNGFSYSGEFSWDKMIEFENQIKKNAAESKRKRLLFYRKKKSQRKKL